LALRQGQPSGDARNDALARFTLRLITTSGTVPADVVAAVKEAGVTDTQIVDVTMAVASIAFTNLFNRINDTTLDFPAADQYGRQLSRRAGVTRERDFLKVSSSVRTGT
jgi:hypothetical protein